MSQLNGLLLLITATVLFSVESHNVLTAHYTECVVAMCVVAMCVTAMCVAAMCVTAMCVTAKCVTAMCVTAMCVTTMCVAAMCVTAMCVTAMCVTAAFSTICAICTRIVRPGGCKFADTVLLKLTSESQTCFLFFDQCLCSIMIIL